MKDENPTTGFPQSPVLFCCTLCALGFTASLLLAPADDFPDVRLNLYLKKDRRIFRGPKGKRGVGGGDALQLENMDVLQQAGSGCCSSSTAESPIQRQDHKHQQGGGCEAAAELVLSVTSFLGLHRNLSLPAMQHPPISSSLQTQLWGCCMQ